MEVKIKNKTALVDAKVEMVDGVMIVSPQEEQYIPKNGDICKGINCLFIFKQLTESDVIVYHCCLSEASGLKVVQSTGVGYLDHIRPANEEEKQLLLQTLEKEGYCWNDETKEVEEIKWKPKFNDKYYHPVLERNQEDMLFLPIAEINDGVSFDNVVIKKGWAFQTREECQELCNKLNDAINSVWL